MERFNDKGIMIFPDPPTEKEERKKIVLVKELFCPNGHNLISKKAAFNGNPGILVKVKCGKKEGLMAMSPIYDEMYRITVDIELEKGELIEMYCPHCDEELPGYAECECGGDFKLFYHTKKLNTADSVGICNRVDCPHCQMTTNNEIITMTMINAM